MYDELIKQMMACCKGVPCKDANCGFNPKSDLDCIEQLLIKAADAIEELLAEREENYADSWKMAFKVERDTHRWIPVTERLPEKDGKYLTVHTLNSIPPQPWIEVCWFAKDLYKVDKYDFHDKKKKSGFYQYDSEWGNFERTGISHWMPIPEPPEVET